MKNNLNPSFRKVVLLLLPVIAIGAIFAFSRQATAAYNPTFVSQVEQLINQERSKQGMGELKINSNLEQAAKSHNDLMDSCTQSSGKDACFKHQLSGEPSLGDRVKQAGYNWNYVSENIAWGYDSPSAVVNAWMNSSGHRANILSTQAADIGCAFIDGTGTGNYSRLWWTCDFGRTSSSMTQPVSSTPRPTSSPTQTPRPTPVPTEKPVSTPLPTVTPTPTVKPTQSPTSTPISRRAPRPTLAPIQTPKPVATTAPIIEAEIVEYDFSSDFNDDFSNQDIDDIAVPTPPPAPSAPSGGYWWCKYVPDSSFCTK